MYVFEFFDVDNIVTLKSGSEVTQTDTMGKLGCGFLFVFHSRPNYGSIVHHFPDKARYWSKIVIFFIPLTVDAAVRGGAWGIAVQKLEWPGYPMVKNFDDNMFSRFDIIPACDRETKRRTDGQTCC